ncbi:MAG: GTPase ObgE [Armatimonadetes bacterium]|nr:GTPase ObgE [Armatimonadota bacterium]
MFMDQVIVELTSGSGGSGAVAFHREKHVPRGGPNGSDGGRGGDVILVAERGCRTLYDFKLKSKFRAEDGVHAVGNKRGRNAKDIVLKVPVGTVVTDTVLNEVLADLNFAGAQLVICQGGRGGHGNAHYVSSVRQVPNFAQKGAPGETVVAKLELKLLADVGLIGKPNAGKSTLLSQVSAAKPKIADYPFTTIAPNLGVVKVADQSFVLADMPGLIEGASEGHGLGHQFLRHIERTKILVHVVDIFPIDETDPLENFNQIEEELRLYNEEIWQRPRLLVLNKLDLIPSDQYNERRARFEGLGIPIYPISAATGDGIANLLFAIGEKLKEVEATEEMPVLIPPKVVRLDDSWDVVPTDEGFELTGRRILRMVAMTNLENSDSVRYLHRRLDRMGVIERLRELGAQEGDTVFAGAVVFEFSDL